MPIRVQRRRTKGWKMPPNTVYVGRPTQWGNPWHVGGLCNQFWVDHVGPPDAPSWFGIPANHVIADAQEAVEMYRKWLIDIAERNVPMPISMLRGKDLACWCALTINGKYVPCHADVLLSVANGVPMEAVIDENIRRSKREAVRSSDL